MYWKGLGVQQSDTEAVKYWAQAAELGHAPANNELAYCYRYGRGTNVDMAKAIECYLKAAQGGVPAAQFEVGTCTA